MTENMKISIKKIVAVLVFFALFIFLVFHFFVRLDYHISYQVDSFQITESYHSDFDYYSFTFEHEDGRVYYALLDHQDFFEKKVVTSIESLQEGNEKCILPKSKKVNFNYLCHDGDSQISSYLVSDSLKNQLGISSNSEEAIYRNNEKTTIYNSLNDIVFVWNYRGFSVIDSQSDSEISLFSKDIYQPSLISNVKSYLIIPDYEQEYFFNRVYVVDMKTKKSTIVDLPNKISFDSRILGVYDNTVYLIDKHEQKEWKFDVETKALEQVGNSEIGKIYQNGFQEVSINKLVYQDVSFNNSMIVQYENNDGSFYQIWDGKKIKIRDNPVKSIVGYKDGTVYYLIEDCLYSFSETMGERKILQNFEWNFNYSNVIFIV